jgi:hypothetical protein
VAAAQPAGYKIAEKYTQKSPETQRLCSAGQVRWGNQSGHKHFYQLLLFRYSQWGPTNALLLSNLTFFAGGGRFEKDIVSDFGVGVRGAGSCSRFAGAHGGEGASCGCYPL